MHTCAASCFSRRQHHRRQRRRQRQVRAALRPPTLRLALLLLLYVLCSYLTAVTAHTSTRAPHATQHTSNARDTDWHDVDDAAGVPRSRVLAAREQHVRALQQQLLLRNSNSEKAAALPRPPRAMGVHTACTKYAKACPMAYVEFLEQHVRALAPATNAPRNSNSSNNNSSNSNSSNSVVAQHALSHRYRDAGDDEDDDAATMRAVAATWAYAQRARVEDLRNVVAALERRLRVTMAATTTTACASVPLPYDAPSSSSSSPQSVQLWLRSSPSTTVTAATAWWTRVRCTWWCYRGVRCVCAYAWRVPLYYAAAQLCDAVVWCLHTAPTLGSAVVLVFVCAVCLYIAFAAPLPHETVALLQRAHDVLLLQQQLPPSASPSTATPHAATATDTSDATRQRQEKQQRQEHAVSTLHEASAAVHEDATTTAAQSPSTHNADDDNSDVGDNDEEAAAVAQDVMFARRRALVLLHGLLDEHAEVQLLGVFMRVQLALYALTLIALLGSLCVPVVYAYDATIDVAAVAARFVDVHVGDGAAAAVASSPSHAMWSLSWLSRMTSWLPLSLSAGLTLLYMLPLVFVVVRAFVSAHGRYASMQDDVALRRSKQLLQLGELTARIAAAS